MCEIQTRWGVGFGPRDCSDYQSGISVIPIHKLTEADRKWMLTAPFGGSGGRPIVTGLCVEEPDIEIGAGVSSKAISRRMQTDKGGSHGPKSTRRGEDEPGAPGGGFGAGAGGHGYGHMGGSGGGPGGGGPPSGGGGGPGGGGRWRHKGDKHHGGGGRDQRRDGRSGNSDEPIVMDLPAGITMGPNGITYPPNFSFGAAANP
jgi:protein NRD1